MAGVLNSGMAIFGLDHLHEPFAWRMIYAITLVLQCCAALPFS